MLPVRYAAPSGPFHQVAGYRHDRTTTYRVAPGWSHAVWYLHGDVPHEQAHALANTWVDPATPGAIPTTPAVPPSTPLPLAGATVGELQLGDPDLRRLFVRFCNGEVLSSAEYARIDANPMPPDIAQDCWFVK